jgi:phosphate transport system permease protein
VTTLDLRPDELADDDVAATPEPGEGDNKGTAPGAAPAVPRRRRPRTLSRQDILALVCSLLASFALVEIGYEHILDFSGLLGFLVCWYAAFVAVYALVLSVANSRVIVVERLVTATLYVIAGIVLFALGTAIVYVLGKGWHALVHVNFFTHDMSGVTPNAPLNQGGIYHAIVGTVIEVGIAVAISLPLGIVTAVFMTEVGGRGSQLVRTVVEAMTALPEILAGLFVYVILIVDFGLPKSGIAASVAMAVTMTPIIARAGDVALRVVPGSLREASNALGAKHWRTVYRVVLPTARIGLSTALILAIARGIGETAIPLICSNASSFLTYNPLGTPMNSLPLYIYTMYSTHEPTAITRAFGAASVLLLLVLALFVVLRVLVRVRKVK